MQHSDDVLGLMALGESVDPADEAHVRQCPRCQSRLDQWTAVVTTTRSLTPDDSPVAPPPAVWQAISRELSLQDSGALVVPLPTHRPRRPWLVLAAAAAGIVLGTAATLGVLQTTSQTAEQGMVIAQATLAPLTDADPEGSASIRQIDGQSVLVVSVPGLPSRSDGYYEVWMATPDTSTMVAIGTLNPGAAGTFTLPAGMDMRSFPVVDVSAEEFDGDTGHSAISVVRGQLTAPEQT